jgi:hypothetical protein
MAKAAESLGTASKYRSYGINMAVGFFLSSGTVADMTKQ